MFGLAPYKSDHKFQNKNICCNYIVDVCTFVVLSGDEEEEQKNEYLKKKRALADFEVQKLKRLEKGYFVSLFQRKNKLIQIFSI